MPKPLRLRPVTEHVRSVRSLGVAASVAGRSEGLPGSSLDVPTRAAPWLSFNATALPSPVADSAPSFGPKRFLLGSNLPWIRYGLDIGSSAATPDGGLHANAESAGALDEAFARLRREGAEHARVFLFCDGRAGICFGTDGTPEGLDDSVFEDVDVLLAAAERHRIGLCLVLFDAGLVAAPSEEDGVRGGGHADVLGEPAKREALLEHVLEPVLRRYGTHPAIDAWDIFDEPECATQGMACPHPARPRGAKRWAKVGSALSTLLPALGLRPPSPPAPALIPASAMRGFLGAAVQAVHLHTRSLATVGLASTANLGLVEGLGLDFYQAHWWEPYGDAPLRRAAADFRLDRPLVLGAFPASTKHKSAKTVLDTVRCAGYGGAFLWSLRAVDACGGQDGQLAQWARNHAAQLYRRPPRVEVAAEPAPDVAPKFAPPEMLAHVPAASDGGEDDAPRAGRTDMDSEAPGLAAAPA
jgi:hypothetical protein